MLSKTQKNTPARLAAGLVGTGALGLAALGLTASGSQAAEQIKVKVETVTGISLDQDVPAPPTPQTAPSAPSAPVAPEAPTPPEGPVKVKSRYVYTVSSDDKDGDKKDGKRITKMVMIHADGTSTETAMPDLAEIQARIPEIRSTKCSDTSDGKPVVENFEKNGKKVMIICSNRIERISVDAEKMALKGKLAGMNSAMMGLRMARRSIENQPDLSPEQRAKALKGIDEAIAEVEKDGGKDD